MAHAGLPLTRVAYGGSALEPADGERPLQVVALALPLAVVGADQAEGLGERDFLAHDSRGLLPLPRLHVAQVARDVDVRGAAGAAGHHVVLTAALGLVEPQSVHDRARGAHLDAGPAEAAARLLERDASVNADAHAILGALVVENSNAAQLVASINAATTAYATREHMSDKWVRVISGDGAGAAAPARRRNAKVLVHRLQLADAVLGAAGAIRGVGGENELHGHPAYAVGADGVGVHDHTLLNLGLAGGNGKSRPVYLDRAEPAAAHGLEVEVLAEVRDEDPRIERGIEHRRALSGLDLASVNGQLHHVPLQRR